MKYSIQNLIEYCEKQVSELQAEQNQEPWMAQAIEIETEIANVLRSVEAVRAGFTREFGKPEPFNDDAIGHAIRVLVPLQREVDELRLLVNNSTQPENIAGYQEQLRLKEEELGWVKQGLRELKERQKLHLQNKLHGIDLDIEHPQTDAFDLQELRDLRARVVRKIETLDTELKNL